jgi:hypothetical protein
MLRSNLRRIRNYTFLLLNSKVGILAHLSLIGLIVFRGVYFWGTEDICFTFVFLFLFFFLSQEFFKLIFFWLCSLLIVIV